MNSKEKNQCCIWKRFIMEGNKELNQLLFGVGISKVEILSISQVEDTKKQKIKNKFN